MTEQEKSELARPLKRNIEDLVAYLAAHPDSMDACDVRWRIKIGSIALASLTAQPVRLPESKQIHCEMDFIRKEKAKSWNAAISLCSRNIRAAGYEVQE